MKLMMQEEGITKGRDDVERSTIGRDDAGGGHYKREG